MVNCSTCIAFSLEQIFKHSRRGEIFVHENSVAQSLASLNNLQQPFHALLLSCGMLPLLAQIHTHIISVAHRVTKFANFDTKSFMYLWNIVPKDYSSFAQHDHLVHSKMFCRIVQFTNFVVQCVKNLSYFPKSIVVWVVMVWGGVVVFKMKDLKNVEEVTACHYIWIKWSAVLLLSGPIIFWGCDAGHAPFES